MAKRRSNFFVVFLARLSSFLFIGSSAAAGIINGYNLGIHTSELTAGIWSAASLACSIGGPIAFYAALIAGRSWQPLRCLVAFLLGAACLAYCLLSNLAFVGTGRADLAATRAQAVDAYQMQRRRADVALAELKTLATSRPGNRKIEAQRAERREELERIVDAPNSALHGRSVVGASDPVAASVSAWAAVVGWNIDPSRVGSFVTLAIVLVFEVGSATSLFVVGILASERVPARKPETSAEDSTDKSPPRDRDEVIDKIRERGQLNGSLASIGKELGIGSKSTTHRVLGRLADAGMIKVDASGDGTRVSALLEVRKFSSELSFRTIYLFFLT